MLLERDGRGEILKARGRILTLTANEAVSCGLAKGVVQNLSALGKSLSMADWKEISPIYTGTAAKLKQLPEGLYEDMFQTAESLNLDSELSTVLQRQTALKEWDMWLKNRRIIGLKVALEVFLIGANEERAKAEILQVENKIASVDASIDSVRKTTPTTIRN